MAAADHWEHRIWYDPEHRVYEQLVETDAYDVWLVGWAPGQAIAAHDHGLSSGVVVVTHGQLINTVWSDQGTPHSRAVNPADAPLLVEPGHAHALANLGAAPATSIHVYSPPLRTMRWFAGDDDGLRRVGEREVRRESSHDRSVETVLGEARARLRRLVPEQARLAAATGALLVDIRPEAFRRAEGAIPGALVVERNVLEWRLDPTSPDRLPEVRDHDTAIVVFCNEGYASSLRRPGSTISVSGTPPISTAGSVRG